jgi:hypothetical protein
MLRTSKRRVKATHLAKTVEKPKPKVRFSQPIASCRKLSQLAFFRNWPGWAHSVCRKTRLRAPTSTYGQLAFLAEKAAKRAGPRKTEGEMPRQGTKTAGVHPPGYSSIGKHRQLALLRKTRLPSPCVFSRLQPLATAEAKAALP